MARKSVGRFFQSIECRCRPSSVKTSCAVRLEPFLGSTQSSTAPFTLSLLFSISSCSDETAIFRRFLTRIFIFCRFASAKTAIPLKMSDFLAKAKRKFAFTKFHNILIYKIILAKAKTTVCFHLLPHFGQQNGHCRRREGKITKQHTDLQPIIKQTSILPSLAFTETN